MHSFEVRSNESACRKKVRLGLEQVTRVILRRILQTSPLLSLRTHSPLHPYLANRHSVRSPRTAKDNDQPYGKSRSLRDSHSSSFRSGIPRRSWKPPIEDHHSLAGVRAVKSCKSHRRSAIHYNILGRYISHYRYQPLSSSSINLSPVRRCRASILSRRLQRGGEKYLKHNRIPSVSCFGTCWFTGIAPINW